MTEFLQLSPTYNSAIGCEESMTSYQKRQSNRLSHSNLSEPRFEGHGRLGFSENCSRLVTKHLNKGYVFS